MPSTFLLTTFATAVSLVAPSFVVAQDAEHVALEISEETTFFTEPANDDGTIDYVAALNAHYGEGVRNEDNAFVLLFQLFPENNPESDSEDAAHWSQVYQAIGIIYNPEFPQFIGWHAYAEEQGIDAERAEEIYSHAINETWTQEQFPLLAQWLEVNASAFVVLREAIGRDRYFSPMFRDLQTIPLIGVPLPQLRQHRVLAKAIAIHAFLAIGSDDLKTAADDLLLLHRMGSLVSRDPDLIGVLVGVSIHAIERMLIYQIAAEGHLNHELAQRLIAIPSISPADHSVEDAIAYHERAKVLEAIQLSYSTGSYPWHALWPEDNLQARVLTRDFSRMAQHPAFDINRSLRRVNERFEELNEIFDLHVAEQESASDAFDQSLLDSADILQIHSLLRISQQDSLPPGTQWTVESYTDAVTDAYIRLLMPKFGISKLAQIRSQTGHLVGSTAIALLGYRDVHGELPETLDALVPVYFEAVPIDPYSDAPLVYRVDDDGSAVVYSIGDNFVDDEGVDDYRDGDIAIRIGVPAESE